MRRATVAAALAVAIVGTGVAATATPTGSGGARVVRLPAKPCKFEDGPGPCFWDAGVRGNGHGRSYWITRSGAVRYLDPGYVR